jgi:hypothetical protein
MNPIQVILVIFAAFALSRVILRFKDKHVRKPEFIIWSTIWLLVIIVGVYPEITGYASKLLGIQRPIDLAIYTSILVLFALMFRLYVLIDNQERELTKFVRHIAIKNAKRRK